jgi:hypothetical protein
MVDAPEAAYYWQRACEQLAQQLGLSLPDALDLVGFPPEYLRHMGLDGATLDAVAQQVDAAEEKETGT